MVEEAGEETDGMAESTSALQEKLLALTHGQVNIMKNANEFKNTTEILREMSAAWKDMTDIERASALELMGGKRQANILSSLISNFDTVEEVIQTSLNSQNSAYEENLKWLDSIEGKTTQFTNALQTMWNNAIGSEAVKDVVDLGTALIKVVDTLGLIPTILTTIVAFQLFKVATPTLKSIATAIGLIASESVSTGKSMGELTKATKIFGDVSLTSFDKVKKSLASIGKFFAANPWVLALTVAIAATTTFVAAYKQAEEAELEASQAAAEHAKSVEENNKSLDSYKEKILSLTTSLNEGALSEEEAYNARKELISIQDELISKYGKEAEGINLVTGAIKDQIAALDGLKVAKAEEWLNENNKKGGWWIFETKSPIEKAIEQVEGVQDAFLDMENFSQPFNVAYGSEDYWDKYIAANEEFKQYIENELGGEYIAAIGQFKFSGKTRDEIAQAYDQITEWLYEYAKNSGNKLDFGSFIGEVTSTKDKLIGENYNTYKANFDAYLENTAIKSYTEAYGAILDAQDKFNKAYMAGDKKTAKEAQTELVNAIDAAKEQASETPRQAKWFDSLDDDFQAAFADINFESAWEDASTGLKSSVEDALKSINLDNDIDILNLGDFIDESGKLKNAGLDGFTQSQADAYMKLDGIANQYGMTIDQLISKLVQLGMVQGDSFASTSTFDIKSYEDSIDTIQSSISSYREALTSLQEGSFTMDDYIDLIQEFPELAKGVDTSSKSFDGLTKNLRKAIKSKPKELIKSLEDLKKKLKTEEERKEVQKLIDLLEELDNQKFNSLEDELFTLEQALQKAAELSNALENAMNLNPNKNFDTVKDVLGEIQGLLDVGKIGSYSPIWDMIEALAGPEAATALRNAQDIGAAVQAWIDARSRYYPSGDDGLESQQAAVTFFQDFIAFTQQAAAAAAAAGDEAAQRFAEAFKFNENGEMELNLPNESWGDYLDFLNKYSDGFKDLNMSLGEFAALMMNMGQYNPNLDLQNFFDLADYLNGVLKSGDKENITSALDDVLKSVNDRLKNNGLDPIDWSNILNTDDLAAQRDAIEAKLRELKIPEDAIKALMDSINEALKLDLGLKGDPGAKIKSELSALQDEINQLLEDNNFNPIDWDKVLKADSLDEQMQIINDALDKLNLDDGKLQEYKDALQRLLGELGVFSNAEQVLEGDQNRFLIQPERAEEAAQAVDDLAESVQNLNDVMVDRTSSDPLGLQGLKNLAGEAIADTAILIDYLDQLNVKMSTSPEGLTSLDFSSLVETLYNANYTVDQIVETIEYLRGQELDIEGDAEIDASKVEEEIKRLEAKRVDIIVDADVDEASTAIQGLKDELNALYDLAAKGFVVKADVKDLEKQINKLLQKIKPKPIDVDLDVDDGAENTLATIREEIDDIAAKAQELIANGNITLRIDAEYSDVVNAVNQIQSLLASLHDKTITITTIQRTIYTSVGGVGAGAFGPRVDGTAHAAGTAHKGGDWGVKKDETALVGELGPELIVRGSKWFTVGDDGAEFTSVKKGDIIFNHKQTEDLLTKGYVTGRGKAYAQGTAYANSSGWNGAYHGKYSGGGDDSDTDDYEETIDWFEILLEEINEQLDLMNAKLENAVGISAKGSLIDQLLNTNHYELKKLAEGVKLYTDYAAKKLAEVPAQYRDAVQNGAVDISEFIGEANKETVEAINNYREWAEKIAETTQQIEEVQKAISDLRIQALDMIKNEYDNEISLITNLNDRIEDTIDLLEERGDRISAGFYEEMIANNEAQLKKLQEQRNAMQDEFNDAVASGDVKKYSDAWYEMLESIYDVDSAIIECTTSIEEFDNAILELHWENFDKIVDALDTIVDESEQIRSIIRDTEITDDAGNWTQAGITALGMAAQEMENARHRADLYAEQIEILDEQFANGKYSQDEYREKLAELKEAQWDSIDAYESAKDTIVKLNKTRIEAVKTGLKEEIDAYEELIKKRKEDLNAQKDAYDWANTLKDRTDAIDKIQQQIDAMSGDTSAAANARRKKLQEELDKAQRALDKAYYDRSITTQQEALDNSLEAYRKDKEDRIEELNSYLEKEDQVIKDSYALILANTESVAAGLEEIAAKYNISISENITSPWSFGMSALGEYGTELDYATSTYVDMLERVRKELIDIQVQADKTASSLINSINNKANDTQGNKPVKATTPQVSTVQPSLANGAQVTVKKSATNFARDGGNGTRMQSWVPGSTFTVYQTSGDQVLIGIPGQGYTGWVRKQDLVGYAKGTKSVKDDQLAWIDENGLEELVLHADGGKLSYLTKGSSVIPSDITDNLMELGKVDYRTILDRNRPEISAPYMIDNKLEINLEFGSLLHVDSATQDSIPEIQKMVRSEFDSMMKQLNSGIKRYAR